MIKRLIQKFRGLIALLAVSVAAASGATIGGSEPMAWRFAHPEAQILAGVDFRRLAETADGKQIRDQFVAALGAPILDQTERMLLSSVVESNGKRSDVLVLSGSFSLAQLRKMAMGEGARMMPYKGLEIAAPAGAASGDPHLAWITGPGGGTTVLIGTRPAIQAAAERSKAQVESLAAVNPLYARAHDLGAKYSIWVSCETVPTGFGPKSLDAFVENGSGQDIGQVDGFDVGVKLGKSADLNVRILTSSDAAAEEVLKRLQSGVAGRDSFVLSPWLSQLKGSIEESVLELGAPIAEGTAAERVGPILAAFALPVDVKPQGTTRPAEAPLAVRVKVESNVPMTGIAAMNQLAPAPVLPAPPVVPPPPPKKLFVRIEGMDEGVKDIPYSTKP